LKEFGDDEAVEGDRITNIVAWWSQNLDYGWEAQIKKWRFEKYVLPIEVH